MPVYLQQEDFEPYEGERFSATSERNDGVILQLDRVAALPPMPGRLSPPRQPFELLFVVVEGQVREQGTFKVVHESGASWDIFLVPIFTGGSPQVLQAVFT